MIASNIDEVVTLLEKIASEARVAGDRGGYFAVLYAQMTRAIRDAIDNGHFADGPRVERVDVAFANRYFEPAGAILKVRSRRGAGPRSLRRPSNLAR